ncbi:BrnT family toxin [Cupriavidus sp. WGlv3]|uniref:BrnT family toxin n=1 Tax=Cupriavidus sp. WGlv3 TaxID=2919924 RepID=UPI00209169F9|nr:BrnT family toxin [Cupriavidus sp. WGlv3]MCO4862552.1 BrnT family toxin [Cupriavidus sp. WGlv3]
MEIEFDLAKDAINQRHHGLSLAAAGLMDFNNALLKIDDRKPYGETRYIAYGPIGARLYCLVFTMRGDVLRAISLRKANSRELRDYEQET